MSTAAQIAANQLNAQHSCGPRTEAGKAASSLNHLRHGFTGAFSILEWENRDEFEKLSSGLMQNHQPADLTEELLVKTMAQSYWLRERALILQSLCFDAEAPVCEAAAEKQLALYLRYQTTHDRAFNKALDQLLKLRAEKRKAEIGFESQKAKQAAQQASTERQQAQETRRAASETRAQELHQARVWLTEAHARRHETETTIAQVFRMPKEAQQEAAKAA